MSVIQSSGRRSNKKHNLIPADCVPFAFGQTGEYQDLNRGTEVNRLCIADQIGDKV